MFSVIVYDIQKNSKRTKIAKILEKYGERVQKSVFECDLNLAEMNRLKGQLSQFEYDSEDSIRFYYMENSSVKRIEKIGGKEISLSREFYVAWTGGELNETNKDKTRRNNWFV